jgi:hypothetical protein
LNGARSASSSSGGRCVAWRNRPLQACQQLVGASSWQRPVAATARGNHIRIPRRPAFGSSVSRFVFRTSGLRRGRPGRCSPSSWTLQACPTAYVHIHLEEASSIFLTPFSAEMRLKCGSRQGCVLVSGDDASRLDRWPGSHVGVVLHAHLHHFICLYDPYAAFVRPCCLPYVGALLARPLHFTPLG